MRFSRKPKTIIKKANQQKGSRQKGFRQKGFWQKELNFSLDGLTPR